MDNRDKHETFICRCQEVTVADVEKAIEEGATTVAGVKVRTHAGMGLCQGRSCGKLIARMLSEKKAPEDILPGSSRPPVRVAKIKEFLGEE